MNNYPLISIIVPVYNVENVLHYCVDSLLNQKYPNIQIVLVNDGSKDNSGLLCDEYAKQFKNIISIHKKNGGQSSARNVGLQNANGKYIGFIDSDDYIDESMFLILYQLLQNNHADVSSVGCKLVNQYNYYCGISEIKPDCYEGDEILRYYMERGARLGDYSVCKCLFKREVLEGISFREGFIYEDLDYKFLALKKATKFVVAEIPLYYYVQSQTSTSLAPLKRRDFQLIDAVNILYDLAKKTDEPLIDYYGKVIKYRAPFTLLCRIAYIGFSKEFANKQEKKDIIKTFTKELRDNYTFLMQSPLPFSRKIACTLLCINFHIVKVPMRILRVIKKNKKVKLTKE